MILAFSTKFPKDKGCLAGKSTLFVEKIWTGFPIREEDWGKDYEKEYFEKFGNPHKPNGICPMPKIHTFRHDKNDRWNVGNVIHFNINVRTKNQFQFAPMVKCQWTQNVEIVWFEGCGKFPAMYIDGRVIRKEEFTEIAMNDGFDSVEDFLIWFDEDFVGKIIHWTNKKY
jgi:hypothetical protein